MFYVQRDAKGRVMGCYSERQPGFAEEESAEVLPSWAPDSVQDKMRQAAYARETDPMIFQAARLRRAGDEAGADAMEAQADATVAAIKARYPKTGEEE